MLEIEKDSKWKKSRQLSYKPNIDGNIVETTNHVNPRYHFWSNSIIR